MLFNLIALATLAVVANVAPGPANALSLESHNFVRNNAARHHAVLSKRQSTRPRRCRARTNPAENSSSSAPASSSAPTSSAASSTSQSTSTAAPWTPPASSAPAPAPTSSQTSSRPPTSSAQPPAPAPTNNGGRKACIAYSGNVNVPKMVAGSSKVGCIINWSSWKPTWMNQIPGAQFVPMHWGWKQNADTRRNVVPGFANYILGMNEPNQEGQAQMSVSDGVNLWREYVQPLKSQGYTLVSPACTNAPSGLTWLTQFVQQCHGCTVDHIATHWYGTDVENFISHLQTYRNAFQRQVWVTEYACQDFSGRNQQCSPDKTWAFMDRSQGFLDSTGWIQYYAYFGALQHAQLGGVDPVNRLINDDSSPTPLGRKYLGI